MGVKWFAVEKGTPDHEQRVLVYNGIHVWLTNWKNGLMRADLKHPVTHWAEPLALGLPYPLAEPTVDQDYVNEKDKADARRAKYAAKVKDALAKVSG